MRYIAPQHLFRVIAYCRACALHLHQWPNGQMRSAVRQRHRFEFRFSALITRTAHLAKCAAHLVKRCAFGQMPRILPIGQMRNAFAQMRCAFGQMRRLVKCALHYNCSNSYISSSSSTKPNLYTQCLFSRPSCTVNTSRLFSR